ncbi:MFS transporter [Amycolatopsis sp. cmx-4-61]|uniref:MFS transporter n=1 Tax=Amycolatopsis sp. cmx-4-61 TaxID=2790937 RepID=UPI00397BC111
MEAIEAGPVRLSRNRNYNILWSSLLLSELNTALVAVAFPLLVLATTGSALQLSLVATVLAVAAMVATVPAGVAADRWNRKLVMLVCQSVRVLAAASLAVTLLLGVASFAQLLAVAAVEGLAGAVFAPAEDAALPQVVPAAQLSQAIARNTSRPYLANLAGPALAGLAFGVDPALPFALTAVLLAGSCLTLLFLVLPSRTAPAEEAGTGFGGDVGRGFRWVFGHRVIRTTLVWLVFNQLFFSALVIIVLFVSGEQDVAPGETGVMMAFFGAGGILGAVCASRLVERVPAAAIVLGFSFAVAGFTALMAFVPAGWPLGLVLAATAFFAPPAVTTVMTYQMVVTPDELRGRLSGIVGLCAEGAGALGPLAGGLLLVLLGGGGRTELLVCAASLAVVALGSLASPALRRFPSVREPEQAPEQA